MLQWLKNLLTANSRKKSYEQYLWVEYKIHPDTRQRIRNEGFVGLGHIGYDGQHYKMRRRSDKMLDV